MAALAMRAAAGILLCGFTLAACSRRAERPASRARTGGGDTLVVRFGIRGDSSGAEDFLVRATRAGLIDSVRAQLALPAAERHHINGPLRRAQPGENLHWHWAIETDQWEFAEMSIGTCDGVPSMIEADLETWLRNGRFCPWAAFAKDSTRLP